MCASLVSRGITSLTLDSEISVMVVCSARFDEDLGF